MSENQYIKPFDSKVIMNTEYAKRRPIDLAPDEKMKLILPSDVQVLPSDRDLKKLIKRMESSDEVLQIEEGKESIRTITTVLSHSFGDISQLVAIDRDSLSLLIGGEREESLRYPTAEKLLEEVSDPTLIPPIFVSMESYRDGDGFAIRDGNHRVTACIHNNEIPFLLAYVPIEELERLGSFNINYRAVVSAMPR